MAQIATTHDKKPAEQPRTGADRVADVARDAGDQSRKLANEVAETTASMVERTAANTHGYSRADGPRDAQAGRDVRARQ